MSSHDNDGHDVLEAHGGPDGLATRDSGGVPERFENPGLPVHRHRLGDTDARAAKRAERQVAAMFGLSALGTILTIVAYYAVQLDRGLAFDDFLQRLQVSNFLLGV